MKVYVVVWDDDGIEGVFSTKEKAQKFIEEEGERFSVFPDDYSITEFELDERLRAGLVRRNG